MTKREAIRLLIEHAKRDIDGVGCGVQRPPVPAGREYEVREAIVKIWPMAYDIPIEYSGEYRDLKKVGEGE